MSAADLEAAVTASTQLRPRTKQLYLQHVRAFLAYVGRGPRSADVVLGWRNEMRARKVRPQSINVALNALRFAAREAGARFYTAAIEQLPVKARTPRAEREDAGALTWSQGQRLVAACTATTDARALRDHAMIVLGLRTGLLRFSLCALKLKDLDATAVPPTLTFTKKGGKRHQLQLDAISHAALQAWITWLATQGVTSGHMFRSLGRAKVIAGESTISPALTPDGLYRILQLRGAAVRLPGLSPYVFCVTFRTWARHVGATAAQIAQVTGDRQPTPAEAPAGMPANFLLPSFTAPSLRSAAPAPAPGAAPTEAV